MLAGSNTYTGVTQVNDGSVIITGNESAATGGWAIATASQYASTVNFSSGSLVNVATGNSVNIGTIPGNTSGGTAAAILNVASSVTNAGTLNIGLTGSLNLSSGATWNQSGPINLQPSNTSSGTLGAALIVGSGSVFNYTGATPINLTPALGNAGVASLQISGGTFNTSQGFANAAYYSSPAQPNSSTGAASIVLTNGGTLSLTGNVTSLTSTNGSPLNVALGSGGGGIINTNGFNTSISSVISDATSGGILNKTGAGTLTLTAANTYSGGTNVSGGSVVFAAPRALPNFTNLTVAAGASAAAASFTGTKNSLFVNSLSLAGSTGAWTGSLDLANNDLVVRSGSLGTVSNQVAQGYNNGTWQNSGGIVSSAAAADTTHLTALGVIQNSTDQNGGTALVTTFDGQPVTNTDILVKYTYYGDTNLDGRVDGTDYSRIDSAYLADLSSPGSATGWYNGDFNYDGVIDGSDYTLIDNAYNTQGAQISSEIATTTAQIAGSGPTSAVPEPASLGLIGLSAAGLLGRRRKR